MSESVAASAVPKLTTVPRADAPGEDFAATRADPAMSTSDRRGISSSYDTVPPVFLDCNDREYMRQLLIVRKIKDLLVSEAVNLEEQDRFLVRLGVLNSLRYRRNGHTPPTEAWDELDARLQGLTRYLKDDTGELKRKLQVRLAPGFLYWLPLAMGLLAAFCLCLAVAPPAYSLLPNVFAKLPATSPPPEVIQQIWRFAAFMAWLIALGSLGSVAFLYVNVLSIETDKSVDVTSASFLSMRIILGALFGLVIGLPIGYPYFVSFCLQIHDVASAAAGAGAVVAATKIEWSSGLALLLPFLLGFSTPLVLNVLNRCVDGVQTVFGIQEKK
jgi:hypothetical protein